MTRPTGSSSSTAETRGPTGGDPAPQTDEMSGTRADYAPTGADPKPTTGGTVKRTLKEFSEDNLTDWAAALTYYGLLSLFPALIALVSILGLFGDPQWTTRSRSFATCVRDGCSSLSRRPIKDSEKRS